ncbi:MAG: hypothetical protein ACP5OG_02225 [Candidatus Nanoarchaeia archaeon]
MEIKIDSKFNVIDIVKKMFYLAWNACRTPKGMGILQDNPCASEEDVWKNICNSEDYNGMGKNCNVSLNQTGQNMVHADYVFGRMMKLTLSWNSKDNTIKLQEATENYPNLDYQAWCKVFTSEKELYESALKVLTKQKQITA